MSEKEKEKYALREGAEHFLRGAASLVGRVEINVSNSGGGGIRTTLRKYNSESATIQLGLRTDLL